MGWCSFGGIMACCNKFKSLTDILLCVELEEAFSSTPACSGQGVLQL